MAFQSYWSFSEFKESIKTLFEFFVAYKIWKLNDMLFAENLQSIDEKL